MPCCFPVTLLLLQVDQFFGANEQQLRDHIWLWSQPAPRD